MRVFPAALERLTEQFAKLPGIGGKTAQRLAFYLLSQPQEEAEEFADALLEARKSVHLCPVCQNLTDRDVCPICEDEERDHGLICVVAEPKDVVAMERAREYHGVYHVLHGVISPLNQVGPDAIVIVGEQPEMARRAVEQQVSCLIVCQAELPEQLRQMQTNTCIIATPFDAYKAARMIYYAIEVARVCRTDDLEAFHLTDFVDDVREVVLKSRHRSYPILDENDKVVGTLSRYHLIKPRRKRVVLVDHNEAAQSVPGLEQAEIVEIIDHHRLADIQTGGPIYFRNEPVGSTATIISEMYQERGLMPPAKLAGLIAAAIVADTVMFKSPTSTAVDRRMADRMARIANVSLDELGKTIFSASISDDKPADALLFTDFKDFHIADHDFGVSQITCVDSERMMERKDEFLSVMQKTMDERGYTLMILMLTDVLLEGTHLLYLGDEDIITQAFGVKLKDHTCFLPGVVSRKKQVIPMLTALWG